MSHLHNDTDVGGRNQGKFPEQAGPAIDFLFIILHSSLKEEEINPYWQNGLRELTWNP